MSNTHQSHRKRMRRMGDPRKAATSPFWKHKMQGGAIHETKGYRILKDDDRVAQKTSR